MVTTQPSLSNMLQQDEGSGVGPNRSGVGPNRRHGVVDPVLDFRLDLDDDLVKLAWESTQVPSIFAALLSDGTA